VKQLRGDPQSSDNGDDEDGHAGDELPRGHAGDPEPQHHQHGCGERCHGHQREQRRNTVDEFQPLRGCFSANARPNGSMRSQNSSTLATLTLSLSIIGSSGTRSWGNALLIG